MMYDFHLASMLPAAFITGNAEILTRILPLINRYDIPRESIRFSLAESHDGKSVRGGLDLLSPAEGQILADTVERNGGKIKYKGTPDGREPYELCISTWDCLPAIDDPILEVDRYLAFYTLAFALMGRNVKSIYFNDLLGLPNDNRRVEESGELRDIKRTKSDYRDIALRMADPASTACRIAQGLNTLIALVDADPSLDFRGNEPRVIRLDEDPSARSVVAVHNARKEHTLTIINIDQHSVEITIDLPEHGLPDAGIWLDNISGRTLAADIDKKLSLTLAPYQRLWLTRKARQA